MRRSEKIDDACPPPPPLRSILYLELIPYRIFSKSAEEFTLPCRIGDRCVSDVLPENKEHATTNLL